MKKIILSILFLLLASPLVFAEFKFIPNDLHDQGDGVLDYYEPASSAAAAGSDTEVQYNDGGTLAGDSGLTYLSASNTLAVDTSTLYVDGSSNEVGVGTTSPESRLHAQGTSFPVFIAERVQASTGAVGSAFALRRTNSGASANTYFIARSINI